MRLLNRARPGLGASLVFLVAIVSIILLAGSLDGLEFQPGKPFPGSEPAQGVPTASSRPGHLRPTSAPMLGGLAAVLFLTLLVYLAIQILLAVELKHIGWTLLALLIALVLLILLPGVDLGGEAPRLSDSAERGAPPSFEYPVTPLGNPPDVFQYLVIAGLIIIAGLLAYALYRARTAATASDDPVLEEAAQAAAALEKGEAWQNVVIRCYAEMCRRLLQEQGVQREEPMTAREFQVLLTAMGVPSGPVAELTTLFEKARYGSEEANAKDKELAQQSLRRIIQHFQQGAI